MSHSASNIVYNSFSILTIFIAPSASVLAAQYLAKPTIPENSNVTQSYLQMIKNKSEKNMKWNVEIHIDYTLGWLYFVSLFSVSVFYEIESIRAQSTCKQWKIAVLLLVRIESINIGTMTTSANGPNRRTNDGMNKRTNGWMDEIFMRITVSNIQPVTFSAYIVFVNCTAFYAFCTLYSLLMFSPLLESTRASQTTTTTNWVEWEHARS